MKKTVDVTISVEMEIDETKFDEKFLEEFRESFCDFYTISEHLEHLAQLHARGVVRNDDFIEGYGKAKDMGIKFLSDDVTDVTISG